MKEYQRNILILLCILIADQITKHLAATGEILFNTRFLAFNFVTNTGSSFGMLKGFNSYLIWISVIVLGAIMFYYYSVSKLEQISLIIVAGGILGNLIDRIILGSVIDFIDFKFWLVFNIADSCIVVGAILLIWFEMRKKS